MHPLARLDHRFVWHPFTQMREWLRHEPIVIVAGAGAVLEDVYGRRYLDANASIWTNLHGHNHPKINAAIKLQLDKIAHSSALGLANEPATLLAAKLVAAANPKSKIRSPKLAKVFFSDDGSTAVEVALKLAYEFTRRTRGPKPEPRFLTLQNAYHGDTVGAVSLGHIALFHKPFAGLLFKTDTVMAPYCYRCRFNRAKPERADARTYKKCNWQCVDAVARAFERQRKRGNSYAAFVFEPLIQGAAGMIPQPTGWLRRVTEIARGYGALLIADEVMTGFGRTGSAAVYDCRFNQRTHIGTRRPQQQILFACHHEGVQPDLMCLAKGLTGGYLPMAATLTTQAVFDAFLGEYHEFKTFFHGHSYTANQLAAAAALTSIELLEAADSVCARAQLEETLRTELQTLWHLPNVGDIRQVGLIVGVELVRDWRTRERFDVRQRAGWRVCQAMAKLGVLTRPIGDVIVIMPPYCTTPAQVKTMVGVTWKSIRETLERNR